MSLHKFKLLGLLLGVLLIMAIAGWMYLTFTETHEPKGREVPIEQEPPHPDEPKPPTEQPVETPAPPPVKYDDVGRVTGIKGSADLHKAAETVPVMEGLGVSEQETMLTHESSKVLVELLDESMITIGPKSEFRFVAFNSDKDPHALLRIKRGFFKVATGRIGKVAPERFQIKTNEATIGVRGTVFMGHIEPGREAIGCSKGVITVTAADTIFEVRAGEMLLFEEGQWRLEPISYRRFAPVLEPGEGLEQLTAKEMPERKEIEVPKEPEQVHPDKPEPPIEQPIPAPPPVKYDEVGRVTRVQGSANLRKAAETVPVMEGLEVLEQETLVTYERSKVQVHLIDASMITIGPKSEFRFVALDSDKDPHTLMQIRHGFFKVVTGRIGKVAPERFQIKTNEATIEVHGTLFMGHIEPGHEAIGCGKGVIMVTTADAHFELRAGEMLIFEEGRWRLEPISYQRFAPVLGADDGLETSANNRTDAKGVS